VRLGPYWGPDSYRIIFITPSGTGGLARHRVCRKHLDLRAC